MTQVNLTQEHEAARPRRYTVAGHAVEAPRLPAGLYLVATPIGNLRDITLRALEILAAADLVACEDTRVSRKLFDHYGLSAPLMPYHDHNAETARPKILERIAAGDAVALVSDAGTPLISDPGFKLVRDAAAAGLPVTAAPGAAVTAKPAAVASRTSLKPGSEISGVPASDTNATGICLASSMIRARVSGEA